MTVTYKEVPAFPGIKFPVLHRVVYDNIPEFVAYNQYSLKDRQVNTWLKDNCQSPYYHSPGYLREKFIEFEDDEEAMWFALRWA